MGELAETIIQGIMLGGVYSLVALGLVLIYKSSSVLNLAQGEILMILAYILWTFLVPLGFHPALGIFIVLLISVLFGLALERLVFRPLIGQSVITTIILTLILGIFLMGVMVMVWRGDANALPHFIPTGGANLGGIAIPWPYFCSFIVALGIFGVLLYLFQYTGIGLSMRAVAEDHSISQSLGISVKRIFSISWALSCLVAAIGGILLGSLFIVNPALGHVGIAKALPVVLLGGLESVPGALVGGFVVGVAELLGATYIDPLVGGGFRDVTPFILMLIILLVRPYGFFGLRIIERI